MLASDAPKMRLVSLSLSLLLVSCSDGTASTAEAAPPLTSKISVNFQAEARPESDRDFALRALQMSRDTDSLNITPANWNGRQVIFADYSRPIADAPPEEPHITERPVVALWRGGDGLFERADVTLGEHNGGEPEVAAIGFANADADTADELIVILSWFVRSYFVWGTGYEVVVLDDVKPGQTALTELAGFGDRFDYSCDCERRDEPSERARFRTVADVRAELARLGY